MNTCITYLMSNTNPSVRVKCVEWKTTPEKIVMPQSTNFIGTQLTETGLMRFIGLGGSRDVHLDGVDFFPGKIGYGEVSIANQVAQNKSVPVFSGMSVSSGYGVVGVVGVAALAAYLVFKK